MPANDPKRSLDDMIQDADLIRAAIAKGVADALRMHKRAGNPIATWRNGRVEWIQPEDIVVPGDE